MRYILCKIGIHSWVYSDNTIPLRKCKCCLLSQRKSTFNYEFSVNSRTGELTQPKRKWKWKDIEMSKEDLREVGLRKLGI